MHTVHNIDLVNMLPLVYGCMIEDLYSDWVFILTSISRKSNNCNCYSDKMCPPRLIHVPVVKTGKLYDITKYGEESVEVKCVPSDSFIHVTYWSIMISPYLIKSMKFYNFCSPTLFIMVAIIEKSYKPCVFIIVHGVIYYL